MIAIIVMKRFLEKFEPDVRKRLIDSLTCFPYYCKFKYCRRYHQSHCGQCRRSYQHKYCEEYSRQKSF